MVELSDMKKLVLPLYILNWIFGIGVIQCPLGNPYPTISLIYSFISVISYCAVAFITYPYLMMWTSFIGHTKPVKIQFYSNIFMTMSIVGLGWYRSKGVHECLTMFIKAEELMEKIGIPKNHMKMLKPQLFLAFTSFTFVCTIISINAIVVFSQNSPLNIRILMTIVMSYPVIIMYISDATFVASLSSARFKFMELNNFLKNKITSTVNSPQHKRIIKSEKMPPIRIITNADTNYARIIKSIKEIHLQLIKTCQEANNIYGLQILFSLVVSIAAITGHLYSTHLLIHSYTSTTEIYKSLISSIVWASYFVMKILSFSYFCSDCKRMSIKTGDLINELYDDPITNSEVQSEIRIFNVQLIQKPLIFTAHGFITLDLSLIRTMIGSITTYLMIIITLGSSPETQTS